MRIKNQTLQEHILDIVIPVYNEGKSICKVLENLHKDVKSNFRVLICYDFDNDNTLSAIVKQDIKKVDIQFIKNAGNGPHAAVISGFRASTAPYVLVYPADDNYNSKKVEDLIKKAVAGAEIVCPSRFIQNGCMVGAPWLKAMLLRSSNFVLYHVAKIGTHDASNGFRLFSRRVLETVPIDSKEGFTYSIELLAKCHRLGWAVSEVPVQWFERKSGKSRFKVFKWLPAYLKWFFYALNTRVFKLSSNLGLR